MKNNGNRMLRSSILVLIFSLISKFMGLVRDSLIAYNFGTTYLSDIYVFSFGTIMTIFSMIGEGVGTTFIPVLSELNEGNKIKEKRIFVNNLFNSVLVISLIVIILCIFFSKYIVSFFAPGFRNNIIAYNKSIFIFRIMTVSLIFLVMQNFFTCILNTHKIFVSPAARNILASLVYILYLLFLVDKFGINGLAIVTIIACAFQALVQLPDILKLKYRYMLYINWKDERLRLMFKLMLPVILSTSISQINFIVDKIIATSISEGAVSILNYANKVNMLLYSIVCVSIYQIAYSMFSTYVARKDNDNLVTGLNKAINVVLLIMLPATLGMIVLRQPVINLLFKRGAFSSTDAYSTASALLFYSPCVIFFGVRDIYSRAFYAYKDTKTPTVNAIRGIVCNIILNIILSKFMKINGLALATSVSSILTAMLLVWQFNKNYIGDKHKSNANQVIKITLASILMASIIYILSITMFVNINDILKIIILTSIGLVSYIIFIVIFRVREFLWVVKKVIKI